MKSKTVDQLNIVLMLLSCVIAFILPFELFLFSYAVLGPLHYLTELSWLKKRNFFTEGKRDYLFLLGPCLIATLAVIFNHLGTSTWATQFAGGAISFIGEKYIWLATFMVYLAFFFALSFVLFRNVVHQLLFCSAVALAGFYVRSSQPFFLLFAVFLPTLIHVFIFTGLFILVGALKSKSKTGLASLGVFIFCAVSFFVFRAGGSSLDESTQQVFIDSGFGDLTASFFKVFHLGEVSRESVFVSPIGLAVMRFIAFAYTYHYLNWFSKTSIIKWHEVPKRWLIAMLGFWIFSVVLYSYDYKTGLVFLYFLSMLHVFLEFPLNFRSMGGIGQGMKELAVYSTKTGPKKKARK